MSTYIHLCKSGGTNVNIFYSMGVAFLNVGHDLNWRLMLGSTVVLPLIVCCQVYLCPESPRWLIKKNRIQKAFEAFRSIRPSDLQAARDLYYCYVNVEIERKVSHGKNMVWELFTVNRNRRAAWASWIVMFGQSVRGIIYFSVTANWTQVSSFVA